MIFNFRTSKSLVRSKLFDQDTFYRTFNHDLEGCKKSVLIESPYITAKRMRTFYPLFRDLTSRGIRVVVNTKDTVEHEDNIRVEVEDAVARMQELGVLVLYTDRLHRKLAIIDGRILWEGSLNILSQSESCEYMRRTVSKSSANEIIKFVNLKKFLPN